MIGYLSALLFRNYISAFRRVCTENETSRCCTQIIYLQAKHPQLRTLSGVFCSLGSPDHSLPWIVSAAHRLCSSCGCKEDCALYPPRYDILLYISICFASTFLVLPNLTGLHLAATTLDPASYKAHGGCRGWTSRRCTRQPAPWPSTCWTRCCSSTPAAASPWRLPWPTPTWLPCMTSMPSLSAQVQPLASAATTHIMALLLDTFCSPYLAAVHDQHAEPVCSGTTACFHCQSHRRKLVANQAGFNIEYDSGRTWFSRLGLQHLFQAAHSPSRAMPLVCISQTARWTWTTARHNSNPHLKRVWQTVYTRIGPCAVTLDRRLKEKPLDFSVNCVPLADSSRWHVLEFLGQPRPCFAAAHHPKQPKMSVQ